MASNNSERKRKTEISRRRFIESGTVLGAAVLSGSSLSASAKGADHRAAGQHQSNGELLYNGIQLPVEWPPKNNMSDSYEPMPVPYLSSPPKIIPVDVGRQLFVDDFLIAFTDLKRVFHQPVKYSENPLLLPETQKELNQGFCPVAAPFSDGCFYDPRDKLFKLWYMSGWFDGTALATSSDGIHWQRPMLDIESGTNLILKQNNHLRRDGVSIWLDHNTDISSEKFKMYLYARDGVIGKELTHSGGYLFTSPDGIHWDMGGKINHTNDNNTFFFNPFRKKWVFTLRKESRPSPPWSESTKRVKGRARSYWEGDNFNEALTEWRDAVFWFGADKLDFKRKNYEIGEDPQIYKVDAVGYESLMVGLIQMHYGPSNEICARQGIPKLTELQMAFSRDGFHWDRTNRETFIGGVPEDKGSWERGYIHSIGGVCNIVDDKLHFYYTAFRGDENNRNILPYWSGMYANGSTGLATLRRDGFASMQTDSEGALLTRPIQFSGKYLFVNIDSSNGDCLIELCNEDGIPFPGYLFSDCIPISKDSTKMLVKWKSNDNVGSFSAKPVRLKFHLRRAQLYAFWISGSVNGNSGGAIAAGGPGFSGYWDK